ncbi:hypothetical protein [Burkholderia glumae]|nr:hypothetical protein [Burkholderia glumae]AJY62988.1 hypothetical protein KS03_5466 [Burkholderia glumae LMG 2196 = ATCC 33617]MCM2483783.1 hypothetical protein [Burkholderia glumae]MCM2509477.1 hypothetical protein [Burkholderia glumae]MCM2541553.1 hypothetical protein [Burkholderia glumae]MCM2550887.1 hypothetical protein [Burkholderia glumae]
MNDTRTEPPPFDIWEWCALLFALEPIADELARTYVRCYPHKPMTWSTLRRLELEALDRLDCFPRQNPGLLASLRSDIVTMCLPATDTPVDLDNDHFVPVVAAQLWSAYLRLKERRQPVPVAWRSRAERADYTASPAIAGALA